MTPQIHMPDELTRAFFRGPERLALVAGELGAAHVRTLPLPRARIKLCPASWPVAVLIPRRPVPRR